MKRILKIAGIVLFALLFLLAGLVAYGIWGKPYRMGYNRADADFAVQDHDFDSPGPHGYNPASTFSNSTAYLWNGYPEEDWVAGTVLSERFKTQWTKGYRKRCTKQGFNVQVTNTRPEELGY